MYDILSICPYVGLDSWETEDDPELVAVLVASQQEYFDELKRTPSKF